MPLTWTFVVGDTGLEPVTSSVSGLRRRLVLHVPLLTDRERQVLLLVREGLTNTQVARVPGVQESTVTKHLANVYARTDSHSRTQAPQACEAILD
jgi:DNA-binding NarL/FixJ family response regulator